MRNKPTEKAKARILVVDDHPIFREGVVQLINRQAHLACCAEAGCSTGAMEAISRDKPDLVLLDLRLGQEDGLSLIKSLKAQSPASRILVISQHDESIYAERALRAGAGGYIMKQTATDEVLFAIGTVLAGELYLSRKMAILLLHRFLERPPSHAPRQAAGPGDHLSDRELQVFQMLGVGLGTSQIADRLHLSVKTVETHRANIMQKLNLPNAPELVRAATTWVEAKPFTDAEPPHDS